MKGVWWLLVRRNRRSGLTPARCGGVVVRAVPTGQGRSGDARLPADLPRQSWPWRFPVHGAVWVRVDVGCRSTGRSWPPPSSVRRPSWSSISYFSATSSVVW